MECGHNTTNKIAQMFVDMDLSKDLMDKFKGLGHKGIINGMQIITKVLSSGMWPELKTFPCTIPDELKKGSQRFEDFYKNQYGQRNMNWVLSQGNVDIQTTYLPKKYTLVVTLYQAAILCLFNLNHMLTYKEIHEITNLPTEELNNQLKYLFNPRLKVLLKEDLKVYIYIYIYESIFRHRNADLMRKLESTINLYLLA